MTQLYLHPILILDGCNFKMDRGHELTVYGVVLDFLLIQPGLQLLQCASTLTTVSHRIKCGLSISQIVMAQKLLHWFIKRRSVYGVVPSTLQAALSFY